MSQLIQSQYDKLDAVSQQFTEEYERIQRVYAALDARLIRLKRDGWIADAADGFYSSMDNDVMPAVQRLADALSEAARVTLQIKAVFQEAEEEAAGFLRGEGQPLDEHDDDATKPHRHAKPTDQDAPPDDNPQFLLDRNTLVAYLAQMTGG